MKRYSLLLTLFVTLFTTSLLIGQDLFFSEYAEGSSQNKYVEIYNGTGADVDLSIYSVQGTNNGTAWGDGGQRDITLNGILAAGDVYVIAEIEADPLILAKADTSFPYESPVDYNGDDAIALLKDGIIIDAIGVELNDPGTAWAVAGVANATAEHTLVRKESVTSGNTDWAASAGTTTEDSEWIVYPQNTWNYLGVHPGVAPVLVTVRLNTSTNLDTLTATNGFVELRGALNTVAPNTFPDGNVIDWSANSTLHMTNAGGDYWEVTFEMNPEDTLYYKGWSGFFNDQSVGTQPDGGWEGGFNPSNGLTWDTRTFISGTKDTVLDVQYYHPGGGSANVDQYSAPFESKADSVAVYFRVSMAGEIEAAQFDPDTEGPLGLRGDPANSGGTIDWGETRVTLTREQGSQHNGSFYSGVAYFDKDSVTAGTTQMYKFFVENGTLLSWESTPDRPFKYPQGLSDTTLAWKYFNDKKPTGSEVVESVVTWRVSTEALEALGLFDRGVGDYIEVRGPNGWDHVDAIQLVFNPLLQEWTSTNESFVNQEGAEIAYKYYIGWDSSRVDPESPNYIPDMRISDGWEEPAPTGGGNRIHVFQNATEQTVKGDFGFDRQFFNSVPANGVINHDMSVKFSVDMTEATQEATNTNELFRPGTDTVWVAFDGELLGWTQGVDAYFDLPNNVDSRFVALTDPEGDMIYSGTADLKVSDTYPNFWYQLGYRVVYSTATAGSYVQNGSGGAVKGRRYYQYIHPTSVTEGSGQWLDTEWPTSYDLPVVPWTEADLVVEDPPNLTVTSITGKEVIPNKYELSQNYPNPFNPTTTIRYQLAKTSDINITVYNLMGQKVRTLVKGNQNAGVYEVVWNGKNENRKGVASGIYFLRMEAGDFSQIRKMTLIR